MKVLYFLTKSEAGGVQSVVHELLLEHKRRGDTASVMAEGHGWLAVQTEALGFAYQENPYMRKTYNPITLFRAMKVFIRFVHSERPDIVSMHSTFSGVIGRVALRNRIPTVYTSHGWGFTYNKRAQFFGMIAERIASLYASRIVCVSRRDQEIVRRYRIAPEKKLALIYNGVAMPSGEAARLSGTQAIILFIGRFAPPKRQDLLLDAFAALPKELRAQTHLQFIGDGPLLSVVKNEANNRNITDATFFGSCTRSETLEHLAHATVAVLLSDSEGLPMAVLEAMSFGVPVIASAVGGISEAVSSDCGMLVPNEPSAVTAALEALLASESLRTDMGMAARKRAAGKFSLQQFLEQTFNLYQTLRAAK